MSARHPHWSTWFPGTEEEWNRLSSEQRDDLSFAATGCEIAYPRWKAPVHCLHGTCRVRRGEIRPISLVNAALRYEAQCGWLRDVPRPRLAGLYRTMRHAARETGTYNIWKLGWQTLVFTGIGA